MKIVLPLVVFVCLLNSSYGQTGTPTATQGPALFEKLDANRDGSLSPDELPANLKPNFARVDANRDGKISKEEHLAFVNRNQQPNDANNRTHPIADKIETILNRAYAETDNPRQRLDLYLPKKRTSDKPLPMVVFIHGGGWRNGDKNGGLNWVAPYLASGNYAGASIGYRLTGESQWPAQIHDCKAAIRWLKAHAKEYDVDENKIGVIGTSAGGHLVSMLGTSGDVPSLEGSLGKNLDKTSRVACVVNFFGPENFITMEHQPSTIDRKGTKDCPEALLLGGAISDRKEIAREASPVTHVSKGDAPFFTAHGTKDPLVPFAQGQELHAALKQVGVPSLFQEMTDGGHGFKNKVLDERVMQFFDLHLRGITSEIDTAPIALQAK
ncbi:MAG: alpha/beta hydrolase fold domain-containing protein [Pirellula sp.]